MKSASPIHLLERDIFLKLQESVPVWPPADLDILGDLEPEVKRAGAWQASKWERGELRGQAGGYLGRELKRARKDNDPPERQETSLREEILRFPSAPLFGCQSKPGYQVRMEPVHQHTLRLLTAPLTCGERPAAKKIFLMFNGLNEIDYFDFYYDLAGLLIKNAEKEADVACIIHPYPAHLTRYPLIGKYAEKPLQRFITDPSDLFRQYLRHMVEMQWLLSVLVPISYYPVAPGIPLLAEDINPIKGRCDDTTLSRAIHKDWHAIFSNSANRGQPVGEEAIRQSIAVIRNRIGWSRYNTMLVDHKEADPLPSPQIHAIGYSLGGYLAQSVFFSWPFAIGSCTTLCSGGALSELRPERIIHREEWRAITHGLKYEIESGMLEGRIRADNPNNPQFVCGIPASYFSSHFQIFNDIFLQDPHGSYRHRVSEFAPRMFFVVGGKDPIVSAQSILHASPSGGINMIEIAKLSHFIATEGGEWPTFWLPTIARIISSLSTHSEATLKRSLLPNLWNDTTSDKARGSWLNSPSREPEKPDYREPEPLDASRMQGAILDLLDPLNKDGFLFILRNQIPVTLLGPKMLHRRGSVPHYEDLEIRRFWQQLQERRLIMLENSDRITLVVPGRLNDWFAQRPTVLSVKDLAVARQLPHGDRLKEIWNDFLSDWETKNGALNRFDPESPKEIDINSPPSFNLERIVRDKTATPLNHCILNYLPDVWISLSSEAVRDIAGAGANREELHADFIGLMCRVYAHGKNQIGGIDSRAALAYKGVRDWLENKTMRIIRVSAAQSSPQFLGERISDHQTAVDLLIHSALALARSTACHAKDDFGKGWSA